MNERRDLSRRQTTRACRAAVMSLPFQVVQWNDEHTSMIGSNYYLDMEWVHCRVPQQFALLWLFTGGHIAYRLREMMGRKKTYIRFDWQFRCVEDREVTASNYIIH